MTPLQLLGVASELGFSVLQFADNLPLHRLDESQLDTLAAAARRAGIALEVGVQTFNADLVRQYLGIAKRIDAGIVRVALDAEDADTPLDELARSLSALLPRARQAGCRIAIENHFDYPSRQMATLVGMVDDPSLGVCLDVANSICAGEWPEDTIAILAPHTINLHLKDYVIVPDPYGVGFVVQGCPLGHGRTEIAGVLAALDHRAMSMIYEHWLPWPGTFEQAFKMETDWVLRAAGVLKQAIGERPVSA